MERGLPFGTGETLTPNPRAPAAEQLAKAAEHADQSDQRATVSQKAEGAGAVGLASFDTLRKFQQEDSGTVKKAPAGTRGTGPS